MIETIKTGKYAIPPYLTANCKKLIEAILVVEAENRLSLEDIFKHPWIGNASKCLTYLPGFQLPDLPMPSPIGKPSSRAPPDRPKMAQEGGDEAVASRRSERDLKPVDQPAETGLPSLGLPVTQKVASAFRRAQLPVVRPVVSCLPPRRGH
jgi:hypothetical protein